MKITGRVDGRDEVNESFAGGFLEQIFGFVDLRGQIWGSAFVRVIGDHDTSVRFSNSFCRCQGRDSEYLRRLGFGHGGLKASFVVLGRGKGLEVEGAGGVEGVQLGLDDGRKSGEGLNGGSARQPDGRESKAGQRQTAGHKGNRVWRKPMMIGVKVVVLIRFRLSTLTVVTGFMS